MILVEILSVVWGKVKRKSDCGQLLFFVVPHQGVGGMEGVEE